MVKMKGLACSGGCHVLVCDEHRKQPPTTIKAQVSLHNETAAQA